MAYLNALNYLNAAKTALPAMQCIICKSFLCEEESVEIGLGSVCRKRVGYYEGTIENRAEANKLIQVVASSLDTDARIEALRALDALGFGSVAAALVQAVVRVKIDITDSKHPHGAGRYALNVAPDSEFTFGMSLIPGHRWDAVTKVNTFPVSSRDELWKLIKMFFYSQVGLGPKGLFKVCSVIKKAVA